MVDRYQLRCVLISLVAVSNSELIFSGQDFSQKDISGDHFLQYDLAKNDWVLTNQNGTISVPGQVPGNMYTDLMRAGVLGDPYFRFNDVEYRWVHDEDWTYSTIFMADGALLNRTIQRLVCHGLDTIATVSVNGQMVGTANNQFVRYVYDVTGVLQEGDNTLSIAFRSAVPYTEDLSDNHQYPVPPDCPPEEYHPECHANFIRKAQCDFSWDWGPAFLTQGVWDQLSIEAFDLAAIRDIVPVTTKEEDGLWQIHVTTYFDTDFEVEGIYGFTVAGSGISFRTTLSPTQTSASGTLGITDIEPWWPRGYGEPTLYAVDVYFQPDEGAIISKQIKTGFRTVELVQEEIETGLTFYFLWNDLPIFMKGANWIPIDSFLDRVDIEKQHQLIQSAIDSNANTIRVWGGGHYQTDSFYALADQLGLMVWQDIMFACSMYPGQADFLDTVRQEIRHQARRLHHHPSVMSWTANNENEGALVDDWYGTSGELYETYKDDYTALYIDTIRDELLVEDPTRPFLASSPSNGKVTEENGWISESPRPSDPRFGTVHYYNYIDDCLDFTIYPHTRFAAEYGYQSWPSFHTIKKVSLEEDWFYGSEFWRHRQHKMEAGDGTDQLIRRHFDWPDSGDSLMDFKHYIYLTQVMQSLCYKVQTEFYRRSQSDDSIRTMGALYWQHNDIWQAPSWATIDFEGNWKMAHYYASLFFADIIVSTYEIGDSLYISGVNDHLYRLENITLNMDIWSWDSEDMVLSVTHSGDIISQGSSVLMVVSVTDLLQSTNCSSREACFLDMWLSTGSGDLTEHSQHYFTSFKDIETLQQATITVVTVIEKKAGVFDVVIRTDHFPALFVWLEAPDIKGRFSANGFTLLSSEKTLQFYSWEGVSADQLLEVIEVTSLSDVQSA